MLMAGNRVIQADRGLDSDGLEIGHHEAGTFSRVARIHEDGCSVGPLHQNGRPPTDVDVMNLQILRECRARQEQKR